MTTIRKLATLVLFTSTACASEGGQPPATGPSGITYGGGDGTSCEKAVIPQGVKREMDGVGAEYAWLKQHYPGAKPQGQSLTECQGKPADRITVATADGNTVEVFFDISGFFGK
jgi:hypothetical protein